MTPETLEAIVMAIAPVVVIAAPPATAVLLGLLASSLLRRACESWGIAIKSGREGRKPLPWPRVFGALGGLGVTLLVLGIAYDATAITQAQDLVFTLVLLATGARVGVECARLQGGDDALWLAGGAGLGAATATGPLFVVLALGGAFLAVAASRPDLVDALTARLNRKPELVDAEGESSGE